MDLLLWPLRCDRQMLSYRNIWNQTASHGFESFCVPVYVCVCWCVCVLFVVLCCVVVFLWRRLSGGVCVGGVFCVCVMVFFVFVVVFFFIALRRNYAKSVDNTGVKRYLVIKVLPTM